ncbi:MAG: hypothetical protein MJ171_06615 [Clostridia bacterium]|nr:hypothetical protein [Clostridia bacterium]
MIDFGAIGKIKQNWAVFNRNHPKVQDFISGVGSKGFEEGQEVAIAIRYPDGTEFKTGIRVQKDDLDFLETIKKLGKSMK